MTRLSVTAATALLLSACEPEAAPPPPCPTAGGVITHLGQNLTCPDAMNVYNWTDPTTGPMMTCVWGCSFYEGQPYASVTLIFEHPGYWRLRSEDLLPGTCDYCSQ